MDEKKKFTIDERLEALNKNLKQQQEESRKYAARRQRLDARQRRLIDALYYRGVRAYLQARAEEGNIPE